MTATRTRLEPLPRATGASARCEYRTKRLFDVVVAVVVGVLAAPVAALCGVAVRATSRGPVLFRQQRVGRHGEPFELLKFRTMVEGPNPVFPDADRVTAVGRLLRRWSLDELPQLVNVLRGEMSIVGPRPTLAYQVERYTPRQRQRLAVRPGITGLAQVRGRNAMRWAERIELDLDYIATSSLRRDIALVVQTARAAVHGRGVEGHPTDDPLARPT